MFKPSKQLQKMDRAVTDFVSKHPEVEKEATALIDAAVRIEGGDPEQMKREAILKSVMPFRASDFY